MQMQHLGHACLLVETDLARIVVDPGTLSDDWHELTDLSAIAITHQHADHLDLERLPGLLAANPDAVVMTDPATLDLLADHDVDARLLPVDDELAVGDLTLRGVGELHAEILPTIERIPNVGVLIAERDGARLLHPGDALDATPSVDVLALPLNAPWSRASEVIAYASRVGAPSIVPIHDALLSEVGRAVHLRLLHDHTDGLAVADLSDGSRLTL